MRYVMETYWAWLLVALLVGNLVGYCLSWERSSIARVASWPFLAAIAFVIGVIVALLCWFPGRAGLYLETLLHLTFWYVIGGMIGGWLRGRAGLSDRTSWRVTRPWELLIPQPARPAVAAKIQSSKPVARTAVTPPKPKSAPVKPPEKITVAAKNKPATSMEASAHAGAKPAAVAAPNNPEDLKRIRGIGKQNEGRLHGLGVWYYSQIAAWTPENVEWVSSYLAFRGRIQREQWIAQARELAAGHETAFSRRVAAGEVPTSKDDGSLGQKNIQVVKPTS